MANIEAVAQRHLLDRQRALLAEHKTGAELTEVEAALLRIDQGQFGSCERCGGPIGRLRLLALPEARRCSSCAG